MERKSIYSVISLLVILLYIVTAEHILLNNVIDFLDINPLLDSPAISVVGDYYHLLTSLLSAISVLCCTHTVMNSYSHNFNQQLFCLCLQTGFLGHWYYWALAQCIPLPSRFWSGDLSWSSISCNWVSNFA